MNTGQSIEYAIYNLERITRSKIDQNTFGTITGRVFRMLDAAPRKVNDQVLDKIVNFKKGLLL